MNKKKSHVAPRGILEIACKSRTGVELRDNFKFIKNGSRCQEYRYKKVEAEQSGESMQLIIRARPHKRNMCRCGICGQKSPRYDCGNGVRRWRAPDLGSGIKVYVEAEAPRVCYPKHGVVVQQVPWARHHSKFTRNFEDTAVWLE